MMSALVEVVKNLKHATVKMHKALFKYLLTLIIVIMAGQICTAQSEIVAETAAVAKPKKKKRKKSNADLDAYFKGKKKGKNKMLDIKTMISNNKKNNGAKPNKNIEVNERAIYVGNKVVTGTVGKVQGYRICIYNGNNKKVAMETKMEFFRKFSHLHSYLSYNLPNYKVNVGDFEDKKLATNELKILLKTFPQAFVMPDMVNSKKITVSRQ
jgi:hypothetical protein